MKFPFLSRRALALSGRNEVAAAAPTNEAQILPLRLTRNARVLPTRDHVLPLLPDNLVFCEIGVALGEYTENVVEQCSLKEYVAIDTYQLHNQKDYWGGRAAEVLAGRDHREFFEDKFRSQVESGILRTICAPSAEAIPTLEDQSLDVAYVDALHDYDGVKSDLSLLQSKMKPTGLIIVNDYILYDHLSHTHFGVVHAVNEFMIENEWELIYFALHQCMYCDVAIRRVASP